MMESTKKSVYSSSGTVVSGPISRYLQVGLVFHMPEA